MDDATTSSDRTNVPKIVELEYENLTKALQSNEDSGERRVGAFLTVAGTIGAALAFMHKDKPPVPGEWDWLAMSAVLLVFLLGYSTQLRLTHRNKTTDRYKDALKHIREHYHQPLGQLGTMIREAYGHDDVKRARVKFPFGNGGWLEFVIFLNAALVGAFVSLLVLADTWAPKLLAGALGLAAAWALLVSVTNRRYQSARRSA